MFTKRQTQQARSQDLSWGGGRGAYLKNRDQIIINEFYAMQLPKTHETEFQPTVIKLKSGDF